MHCIGIDILGGDHAPSQVLAGIELALPQLAGNCNLHLFGPKQEAATLFAKCPQLKISHAPQKIDMALGANVALQKQRQNSISVGLEALANKEIDLFISAGNSGAVVLAATQILGLRPGISRPAVGAFIPTLSGDEHLLLDAGASANCRPRHLHAFAKLGQAYFEETEQALPPVFLINSGQEANKGNKLHQEAYTLLANDEELNFKGNLETRDLFHGPSKILVTDGFTGNLIIKQAEALYAIAQNQEIKDDYLSRFNYEKFGSAFILGLNQKVLLGHGAASAQAIKNLILKAAKYA